MYKKNVYFDNNTLYLVELNLTYMYIKYLIQ